jgi:dihydrofolate reductase
MRKLVVTENITLDGVIDIAEGWFDPLNEDVDQSDITAANTEHQEAADALLVGRNTFESFREFWPKQTDDPTGVSATSGWLTVPCDHASLTPLRPRPTSATSGSVRSWT